MDWQGILQADAYAGYNQLYDAARRPGPVTSALCWAHARRKFFELADVQTNIRKGKSPKEISPIAVEAVKRIDALFESERMINEQTPEARLAMRQRQSAPLVADLERWLRGERALMSKHAKVAKAIDYLLSSNHWPGFTRFLEDGRVCLSNNAAERSLRGVALGRKSWLVAGSERGDLHLDRHRKAQRSRPPGMARRSHRPHRRHASLTPAQIAPLKLEDGRQNGKHSQGRIAAVLAAYLQSSGSVSPCATATPRRA
jgi:hypothetical protein